MEFQIGEFKYEWIEPWAKIPQSDGWSHHGFAVRKDGTLVCGHASEPIIQIFSPDGTLIENFAVPVTETHGIAISEENGEEILWVVDTGAKYQTTPEYPAQIIKCDFKGTVLAQLVKADFGYDDTDNFCPTSCNIDPNSGHVWIANGYGTPRVHRLSPDLTLELTLDGTEGKAGEFSCPHSVWVDTRKEKTEIYISDRANDRIQVYSPEGTFLRCLSEGLITPSAFGVFGEIMVVAELKARLLLMDIDDNILGYIGEGHHNLDRPGWPNKLDGETKASPLDLLKQGEFNSPHGMCVDPQGNIYVSEWLIGNRYIKLERKF